MDRDLTSHDLWEESLARSRRRREAAASAKGFDLPARGLSVAALVAVTGGTVVSVGAASVIGGDDDAAAGSGGSGSGQRPAAVAKAPERAKERPAAEAAAKPGGATASSTSTAGASAPSQSASFEQDATAAPEPTLEQRAEAAAKGIPEAKVAAAAATDQQEAPAEEAPAQAEQPAAAPDEAEKELAPDAQEAAPDAQEPAPEQPKDDATPDAPKPGGGVAELQQKLGVGVDGDFGQATERALKQWQRAHGLEADGVAGPATREALGLGDGKALKRDKPAPRHHDAPQKAASGGGQQQAGGGGVRELQQALGVGVDGVFGPGTEQALKQWQSAHGLEADGVAGPATREALGIGAGKVLKRRGGGGSGGGSGSDGGSSTIARVVAAANRIASTPYVYGGGHGSFEASGYDCSGSVSYALHGGGLLDSPLDSSALMSYGAPGPGQHITIYANAGHAYMVIDGRRFDTSARSETGSRWSSTQRSSSGYVVRHPKGL